VTGDVMLDPVMPAQNHPTWPEARWIGMLDIDACVPDSDGFIDFVPRHADGYRHARVLLRHEYRPIEFADTPIVEGRVRVRLPATRTAGIEPQTPELAPISVVVCTRDRADALLDALESILLLDYPEFEVVVVDNAARTDATAQAVERLGDPRVRYVPEPVPGLSTARNAGVRAARHELIAFTDDDVVVDRYWLRAIARGFTRDVRVSCVTGLVPSGELRTATQAYFEKRVSWAGSLAPRLVSMTMPPPDIPLFPLQVGRLGTGANFAVKKTRVQDLGGFDEALGAGTAAQGGEDLDMFFRVVTSGDAMATEPSAIVWHRHRSDNDALLNQARGYGLGLGAWLTKVGLDRAHRRLVARIVWRHLWLSLRAGVDYGAIVAQPSADLRCEVPASVGRTEVLAVLGGPRALWRGRRRRAQRPPLTGVS
jgi:glycosyltransferase involved in cell wall biosynthesis